MSTPATTLKQRTIDVPIDDNRKITVRRMYHKEARVFLKKLSEVLAKQAELFKRDGQGVWAFFNFEKLMPQIPLLVASVDDLADYVVTNSIDNAAILEQLDFATWAEVLAAALAVNCGAELKNSFAGIADALAPLLAQVTKTSSGAAPTPSSSISDTTPAT